MRWSNFHTPRFAMLLPMPSRESQLLIRGGFIRQLHAGHYLAAAAGLAGLRKVAEIIREEMDAIGGQEFQPPRCTPPLWKKSGRWRSWATRCSATDRKGAENALGMTEEEVFARLAQEVTSYKALPQIWYQMHTKFRDEPRPKSGLLECANSR